MEIKSYINTDYIQTRLDLLVKHIQKSNKQKGEAKLP